MKPAAPHSHGAGAKASRKPVILAAMPAELNSCEPLAKRCHTVLAGVGDSAAMHAAQSVATSGQASLLMSWGTAGGLDPALKPGTLVICTRIVDATTGQYFEARPKLVARLGEILKPLRAVTGAGLTTGMAVTTRDRKSALHVAHECTVVDMESAAIARVARDEGLPFIALRAVLDPAGSNLPVSALAGMDNPDEATRATLRALARRPWELPSLCQLALWYRRSLHMLSSAALLMENAPGLFSEVTSR
ncbi:MAG: hypothetical protein FJ164_04430 [Gammaproteobacteria bacterium]|nr:hypothetical protein [Gammaproteobacteria bacterium]